MAFYKEQATESKWYTVSAAGEQTVLEYTFVALGSNDVVDFVWANTANSDGAYTVKTYAYYDGTYNLIDTDIVADGGYEVVSGTRINRYTAPGKTITKAKVTVTKAGVDNAKIWLTGSVSREI